MKKNQILQILENSILLFDSNINLYKFQQAILNNNFQTARYFLEIEMDQFKNDDEISDIIYDTYSSTEDLLMDLIINEIDGVGERNKQINTNTR